MQNYKIHYFTIAESEFFSFHILSSNAASFFKTLTHKFDKLIFLLLSFIVYEALIFIFQIHQKEAVIMTKEEPLKIYMNN